ncbi:unnamed protein product [Calicophoron daubneyi]|uniref:EF-hand domain-containing protein n=1 Tax=Calicophoron daubneyi TaxID=300641 RepID=A0AAV2U0D6_CALDB
MNLALYTLNFPFSRLEIHMILLLLDKDKDGFIEFEDLGSSLNQLRMLEEAKTKPPIPTIATPDRGWIKGKFYCLNCLEDANHPYHFEEMFPANTFSEGVVNIIRRHTKLCTPSIKVNQSSDEKKESELTTGLMLTDQGLEGGDEWNPKEATFYYRPSGYIASEWSPTNIPDFMALAHDPILWSKMISEIMLYEERVEKRMAKLGLREQTQCIIPLGLQRRIRVGPGELPPNIVKIILSNESQEQHEQSWILVERSDAIFNVTKLNPKSKNVQQVSSDSK